MTDPATLPPSPPTSSSDSFHYIIPATTATMPSARPIAQDLVVQLSCPAYMPALTAETLRRISSSPSSTKSSTASSDVSPSWRKSRPSSKLGSNLMALQILAWTSSVKALEVGHRSLGQLGHIRAVISAGRGCPRVDTYLSVRPHKV